MHYSLIHLYIYDAGVWLGSVGNNKKNYTHHIVEHPESLMIKFVHICQE